MLPAKIRIKFMYMYVYPNSMYFVVCVSHMHSYYATFCVVSVVEVAAA